MVRPIDKSQMPIPFPAVEFERLLQMPVGRTQFANMKQHCPHCAMSHHLMLRFTGRFRQFQQLPGNFPGKIVFGSYQVKRIQTVQNREQVFRFFDALTQVSNSFVDRAGFIGGYAGGCAQNTCSENLNLDFFAVTFVALALLT